MLCSGHRSVKSFPAVPYDLTIHAVQEGVLATADGLGEKGCNGAQSIPGDGGTRRYGIVEC